MGPTARPDCLYPTGICARAYTFPTEELYGCGIRVLVYTAQTRGVGIRFESATYEDSHKLKAASDSDWQITHSTSGGCIRLAGGCCLAVSRKQDCATNSTAHAEIVAASGLADDVKHAVGMCADLGLPQQTIEFEVDNKALFDVSRNYSATKNLRHLGRRDFRIREYAFAGLLLLKLISTHDNVADLFTKALNRTPFERFRALVCNIARNSDRAALLARQVARDVRSNAVALFTSELL
jgi:hypothetical protein